MKKSNQKKFFLKQQQSLGMRWCGLSYLYFFYTFLALLLVIQYKMKQYSSCYCVEVSYTKIILAREASKNQNVSLNIFNGYEFKLFRNERN